MKKGSIATMVLFILGALFLLLANMLVTTSDSSIIYNHIHFDFGAILFLFISIVLFIIFEVILPKKPLLMMIPFFLILLPVTKNNIINYFIEFDYLFLDANSFVVTTMPGVIAIVLLSVSIIFGLQKQKWANITGIVSSSFFLFAHLSYLTPKLSEYPQNTPIIFISAILGIMMIFTGFIVYFAQNLYVNRSKAIKE